MQIFHITGLGLAVFLFLLSLKNKSSNSEKMLSLLLLSFALHLLLFYLSNQFADKHGFFYMRSIIPLLYGPLLYLYITYHTSIDNSFLRKHYMHFFPFILSFCTLLYLAIHNYYYNIEVKSIETSLSYSSGKIGVISSSVGYFMACFISIKRYKQNLPQLFSYKEKIDLKWLQLLFYGLFVIWLIVLFFVLSNRVYRLVSIDIERATIYMLLCCFVFFIGYNGIRQTRIFSHAKPLRNELSTAIQSFNFESTDKSNDGDLLFYFNRIKLLVENDKLYLNPKLTIHDFSVCLGININYISKAINTVGKSNFYEFINFYRVNEFQERVLNPENAKFTLLAIALECGFNSKASFNRIFKNMIGLTPIEYKNRVLQGLRPSDL